MYSSIACPEKNQFGVPDLTVPIAIKRFHGIEIFHWFPFLFKMENVQSAMHLFPGNIPLLKLSMDAFGLCVFIFLYPYKRG
jgi:hypothetical protein